MGAMAALVKSWMAQGLENNAHKDVRGGTVTRCRGYV